VPRPYRSLSLSGFLVGSCHKSLLDVVNQSDVVVLCVGWPSGCGIFVLVSRRLTTAACFLLRWWKSFKL
jgi:hypothetical protein